MNTDTFINFMQYEKRLFEEIMQEDGLLVTAKGLGLDRLLLKIFHLFCNRKSLVIVLNITSEEQFYFIDELSKGDVQHLPQVISADTHASERDKLYLQGGVFFVTSRILVVDMLTKRLPIDYVTGIIVHRAHKIGESSQEGFVLRMFRENNVDGFIKGFSDNPTAFMTGFSQVERIMKQLFVRKLYLRPRFHAEVMEELENHKPDVVEVAVELTAHMSGIQLSLLDLVEACLRELKKCVPSLDPDLITLENSFTKNFDKVLKFELEPHWNQLNNKTKQLVSDIKILRVILSYLTQYDCVTFYSFLLSLQASNNEQGTSANKDSLWMLLDAANNLFVNAKARVFGPEKVSGRTVSSSDNALEVSPKWEALLQILEEVEQDKSHLKCQGNPKVMICASDERTCYQLRQVLCEGSGQVMKHIFDKSSLSNKGNEHTVNKKGKEKKHVKIVEQKRDTEKEMPDISDEFRVSVLDDLVIVIHPLYGCTDPYSLLRKLYEFQPLYVVLYDSSIEFVRQLEVFKASQPGKPLRVYFLMFDGSVEEQCFLTALQKEKQAFENLIRQKSEMVVPEERQGKSEIARNFIRDTSKASDNISTRKAGGQVAPQKKQRKIIVDMREFRSDLPSLIHRRGIDVEPVTLEVGDYILTPDICVERKSISDLIGSLNNGRLYHQCISMKRFYKKPVLLIEFDESKSFSLQSKHSIKSEVSLQNISSKLTLLTIHFPELYIIWSQSPHLTAEVFEDLKENAPEPDPEVAMTIGVDQGEITNNETYNMVPADIVQKLPGFSIKNYKRVLKKYSNLRELVAQDEEGVASTVENASNAKLFINFLDKSVKDIEEPNKKKKRKI